MPLILISSSALSQGRSTTTIDPMEQILNKLNSIEARLDVIEDKKQVPTPTNKNTEEKTSTTPSNKIENISTTPAKDELLGGAIINIKNVDDSKRRWVNDPVQKESFAGYVASSSKVTTLDIFKNSLGYKGPYAMTAEGYFRAKEKGLYNFGALHEKIKTNNNYLDCSINITINDELISEEKGRIIKSNYKEENILASGSVTLDPGLYEYSVNSSCSDFDESNHITRSFLVKTPTDLSMRMMTQKDIFHKK